MAGRAEDCELQPKQLRWDDSEALDFYTCLQTWPEWVVLYTIRDFGEAYWKLWEPTTAQEEMLVQLELEAPSRYLEVILNEMFMTPS